jgi:hypothetical protein
MGKRLTDKWLSARAMAIVGHRQRAGVTQEQLADKLKWPLSKLVLIECWESAVTDPELVQIALALDMPPEQLIGRIVQWVGCYDAWRGVGAKRISEIQGGSGAGKGDSTPAPAAPIGAEVVCPACPDRLLASNAAPQPGSSPDGCGPRHVAPLRRRRRPRSL